MLVITNTFKQKELKPLRRYYNINDIRKAVNKIDTSGVYLSHLGYKYGQLMKLRMPHRIAGRLIVYIFVQKNWVVPIILRLKNDKVMGENLSKQNIKAKKIIIDRLDHVIDDIEKNIYKK